MYRDFFGFSAKPFDVTPDPRFLYLTPGHREMLASLVYGIQERRGFITMVGEVGAGKTTLLNAVLDQLDRKVRVAFIFNTNVTFDEMLTMALLDLKLASPEEKLSKVEALSRLKGFAFQQLSQGGNVVLLVDEAQNLEPSAMENVRLLSNLETRKHKLIQIVLSGQPELDVKLSQPELRQLSQRISIRRYITPLSEKETYEYIQHRLNVAEYSGPALFDHRAQRLIWEHSGGVPRKINVLCDNALLIGYALGQRTIDTTVIEEAIKDLRWSPFTSPRETQPGTPIQSDPRLPEQSSHSRFAMAASLVLAACTIFFAGFFFGTSWPNLQVSKIVPLSAKMRFEAPTQDNRPSLGTVVEPSPGLRGSDNGPPVRENQARLPNPELSASATAESLTRKTRGVVVKRGESLSWIILAAYGRYDPATLRDVLRVNPEIDDPDRLKVGQVVKLPEKD